MRKTLLGLMRRAGWLYGLSVGMSALALAFFPPRALADGIKMFGLISYILVFCGPLMLSFWLMRGLPRMLASLPLTTRLAGRACWCFAIAIPAFLLLLTAGLGWGIAGTRGVRIAMRPVDLAVLLLSSIAYYSAGFFVVSRMPSRPASGSGWQLKGTLLGAAWGLLMACGPIYAESVGAWERWGFGPWCLCAAGLALSVVGWFESERMLLRRLHPIDDGEGEQGSSSQALPDPAAPSGISFLLRTGLLASVKILVLLVGMLFFMRFVLAAGKRGDLAPVFRLTDIHPSLAVTIAFCSFTGLQWFGILRLLRTLPISSGRLAAILCLLFASPPLIMAGAVTGLSAFLSPELGVDLLKFGLLYGGAGILLPALVFRIGTAKAIPVLLAVLVIGPAFLGSEVLILSMSAAALLGTTAGLLGSVLLYQGIESSSRAYRPNAFLKF